MNEPRRQPSTSETASNSSDNSDYGELRSWFDEVTTECNVIRILLVGKAGSGKSTLVSKVFGFDLHQARVQAFRSAEHNIDQEITSPDSTITPTLRLHDSKGLESGSEENLRVILNFVRSRQDRPLAERLHAIWYCVEIPTAGQRPFEGGDINLLNSLKQCEVPVIIAFTKFDRLKARERNRLTRQYMRTNMDEERASVMAQVDSEASAKAKFRESCVTFLESRLGCASWTTYCVVSQKDRDSINALIEKTEAALKESEVLKVIWASVQVADVDLKMQASVLVGKKMYYRVILTATMIPLNGIRRVTVLNVLTRIHRDIVRVWNLNDPEQVLLGANMRDLVRKCFVEPMISPILDGHGKGAESSAAKIIDTIISSATNPVQLAVPLAVEAAKFLDSVVVGTPAIVRVLMAYIANLTLALETLYWTARAHKIGQISRDNILDAFRAYCHSPQMPRVREKITDYIGDENVLQAWKREKAMAKITEITENLRFDPANIFRPSSTA